jgi:hypothetical protein
MRSRSLNLSVSEWDEAVSSWDAIPALSASKPHGHRRCGESNEAAKLMAQVLPLSNAYSQCSHDLLFSLRQLTKKPGLTIAIILIMAAGIGVDAAVFSVVYSVLLKPLPG